VLHFHVLHCDKQSRFGHNRVQRTRFVLRALIVWREDARWRGALLKYASVWARNGCRSRKRALRDFELALIGANRRGWIAAALLMLALPLCGCATSIADIPLIGVPSDAPARPKEAGAYPAIHDLPADREQSALEPSEQVKLQKELIAARDRQAGTAAAPAAAAAPAKKPPAKRTDQAN
jgi:hypothetical protein